MMALSLFVLLAFLTLKLGSCCIVFTDPNPISFHRDEGMKICSGTASLWCFEYQAMRNGKVLEMAGGCAEWLKEVSEKGPGLFEHQKAALANAYTLCQSHKDTSFTANSDEYTIDVRCFPGEGTSEELNKKETTELESYPPVINSTAESMENETDVQVSLDQPMAGNCCSVYATPDSFVEEEGLEICGTATSPWCFKFTSTIFLGLFVTGEVSGCSEWMKKLIQDPKLSPKQRLFFAEAYAVCSHDNNRSYCKRWIWLLETYNVVCSRANPEAEVEMLLLQPGQDVGVPADNTTAPPEQNETSAQYHSV